MSPYVSKRTTVTGTPLWGGARGLGARFAKGRASDKPLSYQPFLH